MQQTFTITSGQQISRTFKFSFEPLGISLNVPVRKNQICGKKFSMELSTALIMGYAASLQIVQLNHNLKVEVFTN